MWVFRVLGVVLASLTATLSIAEAQTAWRSLRYYGGADYEFASRLAVDAAGNSYVLGYTFSADMDAAIVPMSRASGEPASATFVYKVTPDGARAYAATIARGFGVVPIDLAVGADGSAHVLLRDGDVAHAIRLDAVGRETMHLTFDPRALLPLYPRAIAVDDVGNSVVAGSMASGVFVARIDARGSMFDLYRVPASADVRDVATDAAGDIYVAGTAFEGDLPTTAGTLQPQFKGMADAFVLKVTRSGALAYATYIGGAGWDDGAAIAVDETGAVVVSGETRSSDFPLAAAARPQCTRTPALPCRDGFIARLDPAGTRLLFSTYADTIASALAVDGSGSVYAAAATERVGLATYRAPQPGFGGGNVDGLATAYSPAGQLLWSTYVGGAGDDAIVGIGAARGAVYFGGVTTSAELASGASPFHGARDLFVVRLLDPDQAR